MIQHSMATIAQPCRGTVSLPLLSQDPDYTEVAGSILTKKEFKLLLKLDLRRVNYEIY